MMGEVPLLELDRVTKRFGRVTVADELTLSVAGGDLLGIVGPNGAGKTSVFGLVSGDLTPDSGVVRIDGRPVNRLDAARRCRLGVGRTYQVPRPFEEMTVFENTLVAAHAGAGLKGGSARELAYEVLEETGLAGLANSPAGRLGLLQRKRLELARVFATKPRVLLLDEVAAGLTAPEVDELIGVVERARTRSQADGGIGIVWVEHVVRALISTVGRLVCLDAGHIVAEGRPEEVMADPRVKEVYLGSDVELGEVGQTDRDLAGHGVEAPLGR